VVGSKSPAYGMNFIASTPTTGDSTFAMCIVKQDGMRETQYHYVMLRMPTSVATITILIEYILICRDNGTPQEILS
jgi:hypothetical protein